MGEASKIVSVFLRVWEIICAAVVTGIVGYYVHYLHHAHVGTPSRISYAIAIGSISIFFGLVLLAPLRYSFWAFPLDFAIFVMWMVAFGLLVDASGTTLCKLQKLTDSAAHRNRCLQLNLVLE